MSYQTTFRSRLVRSLTLAAVLGLAGAASAITVTATASKDNSIFSESSNSAGAYASMYSGRNNLGDRRRALVAFNLSGIPTNSTVTSVSVTFRVTQARPGNQNTALHRVTAAWGQGTSVASGGGGQGGAATTNDATWTQRLFPSSNWATAGGDFVTTASATASAGIAGTSTFWATTPQLVADVQGWVTNPSTNQGWIVIGNESLNQSAKEFAT